MKKYFTRNRTVAMLMALVMAVSVVVPTIIIASENDFVVPNAISEEIVWSLNEEIAAFNMGDVFTSSNITGTNAQLIVASGGALRVEISSPDGGLDVLITNGNIDFVEGDKLIIDTVVDYYHDPLTQEVVVDSGFLASPAFRVQGNGAGFYYVTSMMVVRAINEIVPIVPLNTHIPSLYRHFENYFMVGNIYSSSWRGSLNDEELDFLRYHFNAITAEDYHKPDQLMNNAQLLRGDRVVNFARDNDMTMIGHTLVWHSQSPVATTTGRTGNTAYPLVTRAVAIANMESHINEIAGRWAGDIFSWDVVNEVFHTSVSYTTWLSGGSGGFGPENWRNHLRDENEGLGANDSAWFDAFANGANTAAGECGSDFIYYAFRFTRLADPNAILYYNDFNEEEPGKREAIAAMVIDINNRWANDPLYDNRLLIEVIGMQSHYHLNMWGGTNFNNVPIAMQRFIDTGARISITELDITVGINPGGNNPPTPTLTSEQLQAQADAYARLFGYYLEFHEYINRVSFWGLTDNRSWRNWGAPLLFDSNKNPKPAFWAILELGTRPPDYQPPQPTPPPTPTPTPTPPPGDTQPTPPPSPSPDPTPVPTPPPGGGQAPPPGGSVTPPAVHPDSVSEYRSGETGGYIPQSTVTVRDNPTFAVRREQRRYSVVSSGLVNQAVQIAARRQQNGSDFRVNVSVPRGRVGVLITDADLSTITQANGELILTNGRFTVAHLAETIASWGREEDSLITLKLAPTTPDIGRLIDSAAEANPVNRQLLSNLVNIAVIIDGENQGEIVSRVEINLSDIMLSEGQINGLTGIMIRPNGTYVDLGGVFDSNTQTFSYYATQEGIFGVMVSAAPTGAPAY